MASNEATYGLKLAWRAISGVVRFRGRSRRTELFYFWLAALLLAAILRWLADAVLPQFMDSLSWREERIVEKVAGLVVWLPFFALFARRMHDQDRSGWWALALPPLVAMSMYDSWRFILIDLQTGTSALPELPWWVMLVHIVCALVVILFLFLAGTDGPNRFGSDPRDDDPRAAGLRMADTDLSSNA
jgi:uncharacterized membrane protein YhaH (DUF805 family)